MSDVSKYDGFAIIGFNNLTVGGQNKGFAIILDKEYSLLDTISFNRNEQAALTSAVKSCFPSFDNVLFVSEDKEQLGSWMKDIKHLATLRLFAGMMGISDADSTIKTDDMYEKCFGVLKMIDEKANNP